MIVPDNIIPLIITVSCLHFVNYAMLLPSVYNRTLELWKNETEPEREQTMVSVDVQSIEKSAKQSNVEKINCKKNEALTNCTGCELRCDDNDNLQCQKKCHEPGCECPALLGFRRASNGDCIRDEDCSLAINENDRNVGAKCGVTEEYKECGASCEETCENFGQPIICTRKCVAGCFCRKGYIREKKNERQDIACGPNQEYRKCGTACSQTCSGVPENCTQKCVDGCFCKEGYVLDLDKCIPEDNCQTGKQQLQVAATRKCPINEVYRKCGSPCQEICGEQKQENCVECLEGCFCKLGYVMSETSGLCVKPEDCSPPKYMKCPENETFTYCGGCEGTCHKQFVNCPLACGSPRCECLASENYVRNELDECIHIKDCYRD